MCYGRNNFYCEGYMSASRILLVCIFLLGFFLRFYKISGVPVSLFWDEASHAYNAYSILKTGRDEYGERYPLILRSFDDYKRAGYAYLTILPVALFGLNEFSTRFTSAFLGSLTILIVFFLAQALRLQF